MKSFSLLIKPVSFDCNLRCEYCFYLRAEEVYGSGAHRMPDEVLEKMVRQMMGYGFGETVFGWQGGEPTVAGLDFFRRIVELQMKHGRSGQVVGNGLQTNATLIDAEWARFLAKYNWLVGVSIDGPKEIHNRYRRTAGGGETFHTVLRGLKTLKAAGVAVNALVLVSRANVRRARQVYHFIRDQGFDFLQFIPCVERGKGVRPPDGVKGSDPFSGAEFAVTGDEFGDFLCELFDAWKTDGPGKVSIRHFDAVRRHLIDGGCDLCVMDDCCDGYMLVEHNGDVYPCDFFMYGEWKLGNLMETPLHELFATPLHGEFSRMKSAKLRHCRGCEWLALCHGGCPKDRMAVGDPCEVPTPLCEAYEKFLTHAVPFFKEIDEALRQAKEAAGSSSGKAETGNPKPDSNPKPEDRVT